MFEKNLLYTQYSTKIKSTQNFFEIPLKFKEPNLFYLLYKRGLSVLVLN